MITNDNLHNSPISSLEKIFDTIAEINKLDLEIESMLREMSELIQESRNNFIDLL